MHFRVPLFGGVTITCLSLPLCSHYHVVVVILPLGQTPNNLRGPDTVYGSLDDFIVYSKSLCDEDFSTAKAYITAEFDGDLLPASGRFVVGGEGDDAPNDRPEVYTNGLLCFSGSYTFFVRAYTQPSLLVRELLKLVYPLMQSQI